MVKPAMRADVVFTTFQLNAACCGTAAHVPSDPSELPPLSRPVPAGMQPRLAERGPARTPSRFFEEVEQSPAGRQALFLGSRRVLARVLWTQPSLVVCLRMARSSLGISGLHTIYSIGTLSLSAEVHAISSVLLRFT